MAGHPFFSRRRAGALAHVSSLPSSHGIGDFGPEAREFVRFLADAGFGLWQILPLNPVNPGAGNSPYSSFSAFANNPLFVSPEDLVRDGILSAGDLRGKRPRGGSRIDYGHVHAWKSSLLKLAFANVLPSLESESKFDEYRRENASWLEDFALFAALKEAHGGRSWLEWPAEIRDRCSKSLELWRERLALRVLFHMFAQFLADEQWRSLLEHCRTLGVAVLGDMPIYVSLDSADVWSHPRQFELDGKLRPIRVAGAPPDYFSEKGQLWGNPLYDWSAMSEDGFAWWKARIVRNSELYDLVRIDHFRGLAGYWAVPAGARDARGGEWLPGPGHVFLEAIGEAVPELAIVAEDLGEITPDVIELRDTFTLPGMRVLHFAFSGDSAENPHIPHNHDRHSVVYTGTHDNTTTRDWFERELDHASRRRVQSYVGRPVEAKRAAWELCRLAMASCAAICVLPVQDLLNLGSEGRMNTPALADGNWTWRFGSGDLGKETAAEFHDLAGVFGRLP